MDTMAAGSASMICPRCGAVMTRHAEKVDYATERVEEIHACPSCPTIASRPAPAQVDTVARARR
jgi:uncharacterized C2H2 Zn-finger protein